MSLRDAVGRREALETYPVSIPSVALARMAMKVAHFRYYGTARQDFDLQVRKWFVDERGATVGASGEFYRIIDRISAGEAP